MDTETRYQKLTALASRRTDPTVDPDPVLNEAYKRLSSENDGIKYALTAMQPVDPKYTSNTVREGERIQNQLEKGLAERHDFRFQGSTPQDTHIKARSDIDLLVLSRRFVYVQRTLSEEERYKGDPKEDVQNTRSNSREHLATSFPTAEVDDSGSKSIKISGGSLAREIDIVAAAWYDTNDYVSTGDETFRRVKVLDRPKSSFIENAPFLIAKKIADRDHDTSGGYRKVVRLLKSLRYDAKNEFSLSSFDLMSIAYAMSASKISVPSGKELLLVDCAMAHVQELIDSGSARYLVQAPDESRRIFPDSDIEVPAGLRHLKRELDQLASDIAIGASRSLKAIAEARTINF